MKIFRDRKEKYTFFTLFSIISFCFLFSLFFINRSYALPDNLFLSQSALLRPIEIISPKRGVKLNSADLTKFSLMAVNGELFPKSIELKIGETVRLDLNAMDDNYNLILDQKELHLRQGEIQEYYFKTKFAGQIHLKNKDNNEVSKLIIN